ncbi:hypothetical protein C8R32_1161 [Nitrosospira sp. Nsp5]|uniref:Uncharacterized protein n=1 Tax=Nitrosospira multiformis TaxID=1231 RepID=A0ABY0TCH4_9PROT|nr:hypothetical protein [Nitrosospira multiformis]PTR05755.1 hypothetical protein C8R32_1161 [Nitrosospira sp. Nsp5]SDQ62169.1 hypothetical protein SAMN05216402_1584 [Nitrosospira multiformis]
MDQSSVPAFLRTNDADGSVSLKTSTVAVTGSDNLPTPLLPAPPRAECFEIQGSLKEVLDCKDNQRYRKKAGTAGTGLS